MDSAFFGADAAIAQRNFGEIGFHLKADFAAMTIACVGFHDITLSAIFDGAVTQRQVKNRTQAFPCPAEISYS